MVRSKLQGFAYRTGIAWGTFLVSGVLALVSKPGYNPNLFVEGISSKDYEALKNSIDKPLFNRAIRGQYPPGSTVKP